MGKLGPLALRFDTIETDDHSSVACLDSFGRHVDSVFLLPAIFFGKSEPQATVLAWSLDARCIQPNLYQLKRHESLAHGAQCSSHQCSLGFLLYTSMDVFATHSS